MSTPYATIVAAVQRLAAEASDTDPTVTAYMIARAALLEVRALRGAGRAAELA